MTPSPKRTPRASFHEVLVEGPPELVHGFLAGLKVGTRSDAKLFFSHDEGIRTPLGERILEFVHLHAGVCHVVADSKGRKLLKSHKKDLEAHGIRVMGERKIVRGRFDYTYHAYAQRYGEEIKKLLKEIPRQVKREGGEPDITIHKSARGMEAYSPLHHYEIEGDGAMHSSHIDLLIEAHRALDDHPLVNVELIELETEG